MAAYPETVLSLFSGYGGLDLGVEMATGCRTVCYVEREAFSASILVARMAEESLGEAPVWDDVTTFDGKPWRGVVDCVVGGSPCQDLSVAGKRVGLSGERSGLWRHMLRIIGETRPAFVFWENVGGAINTALDVVSEDLERLGYRTSGCVVAASDVGAPHERRRLFVLAHASGAGLEGWGGPQAARPALGKPVHHGCSVRGTFWRQDDRNGPQPSIRRGTDGAASQLDESIWADRLRSLGNGVVPQQAAVAFLVCWDRLFNQ